MSSSKKETSEAQSTEQAEDPTLTYETKSWPEIRDLLPRPVVPVLSFAGASVAATPSFGDFPSVPYGNLCFVDAVFIVPKNAADDARGEQSKYPGMVPLKGLGNYENKNANQRPGLGPEVFGGSLVHSVKQVDRANSF